MLLEGDVAEAARTDARGYRHAGGHAMSDGQDSLSDLLATVAATLIVVIFQVLLVTVAGTMYVMSAAVETAQWVWNAWA